MEKFDSYNLDANESAFFLRQLEYVKTQTYDTKYKALKATSLFPVSMEAGPAADRIVYRTFSKIGAAKIVSNYATDFPRADVYGEEKVANIRSEGVSYGYSLQEIRRSQMAGTQLDTRRAAAAKQAIDELTNSIAFSGDTSYGLQGFINYPGITMFTVPVGASTLKTWASKTPDEIVKDVTGMVNAIMVPTKGREIPDTLLLPLTQYNIIANTRMTDGDATTILQFILKNNPYIKNIEWVSELTAAGASGTDRMMMYTKDPRNITLEIPLPFEQAPQDKKGLEYVIPCHARIGGIIIYYPLSVAYGDGI